MLTKDFKDPPAKRAIVQIFAMSEVGSMGDSEPDNIKILQLYMVAWRRLLPVEKGHSEGRRLQDMARLRVDHTIIMDELEARQQGIFPPGNLGGLACHCGRQAKCGDRGRRCAIGAHSSCRRHGARLSRRREAESLDPHRL